MKYLRRMEPDEKDPFHIELMNRAYGFSQHQIKHGNTYVAILVQASFIEELIKLTILLKIHILCDVENNAAIEEVNKLSIKVITKNSFFQNIEMAKNIKAITKKTAKGLHKYREKRNAIIHEAMFETIKKNEAKTQFSFGNRLIDEVTVKFKVLYRKLWGPIE
jgi:hypothetical protein